jgi:hypothetical protein
MLINPVNFRLSISLFWNSTWSFYQNNNYKYLFYSDLIFFEFFMFFFKKIINLKSLDYYPSHIRLYRLNNKIIINLYYHLSKEDYYSDKIKLGYKNLQKISNNKILKKKKILRNIKNKIKKFIKNKFLKILYNELIFKKNFEGFKSWTLKWFIIKKEIILFFGCKFYLKNLRFIEKIYKKIARAYFNSVTKICNYNKLKNLYNIKIYNFRSELKLVKNSLFALNIYYNKKKVRNKLIFYKIKYDYLNDEKYWDIYKIKSQIIQINWKNRDKIKYYNDFYFLYKINLLKFYYNQKLWLFNLYYYFFSKYFQNINFIYFNKYLKKIELNIFKINKNMLKSNIVSKYITTSFKNNYNIYETMRPILVDLKQHIVRKRIVGFKIAISGRFKRAQRASYWWRKDGHLFTGTQTFGVDYSTSLHKTKYGTCTINVWLAYGLRGFDQLKQEYPSFYPFYFLIKNSKINYFILKKNNLFFSNLLKKEQMVYHNLKNNYMKGLILNLIYKYIYIFIFFKNISINLNKNGINVNFKKFFLPQYCIYKIFLEEYLKNNYIKIIPFINLKFLKRLNLRNSYKIKFLQINKLKNLKIFKYKIYLI